MKKIIGIVLRPDKNDTNRDVCKINDSIRKALSNYDVILIGIIPKSSYNYLRVEKQNLDYESLIESLKICDGVVIPGGYGPFDYDYIITKYCYDFDIPLLGICMGMQVMGEFLGGKLQKVNNSIVHYNKKLLHEVVISKNSKLYDIIQVSRMYVNTRHQEYLTNLDKKHISTKYYQQIEAIEDKSKRFFIGTQWHPEDLMDTASKKLFDKFIDTVNKEK